MSKLLCPCCKHSKFRLVSGTRFECNNCPMQGEIEISSEQARQILTPTSELVYPNLPWHAYFSEGDSCWFVMMGEGAWVAKLYPQFYNDPRGKRVAALFVAAPQILDLLDEVMTVANTGSGVKEEYRLLKERLKQ